MRRTKRRTGEEIKMKIRKAKKEDFKKIAEILRKESSKKPYCEKYTPKKALNEVKTFAKTELYVAIIDNSIAGFIASSITKDDKEKAYVNELWLSSDYQRMGAGKSLIKFIEDKYKSKGIKVIRLVTKTSSGAFKFYKKLKYKETTGMVFVEKKISGGRN